MNDSQGIQFLRKKSDIESKNEKFRRLAAKRTTDILNKLRILGNLANRSLYDYTDAEVRAIFSAIEEQLKAVKAKFISPRKGRFEL